MNLRKKPYGTGSDVSLGQVKEYYDNVYYMDRGEDTCRPLSTYGVFLEYLGVRSGGLLLDIGCGAGHLLKQGERKGLTTVGQDISEKAAGVAKKTATQSEVIVGDAHGLPFKEATFDYITVLGVLEHFLYPGIALKEMHRVCKDNGLLCIVVPNSHYLLGIIKTIRTGYSYSGTGQIHENLATMNEWRDFLESNGFVVSRVLQDKGPPTKPMTSCISGDRNLKHICKGIASKLLRAIMPLVLTYQFVFILRKRTEGCCM